VEEVTNIDLWDMRTPEEDDDANDKMVVDDDGASENTVKGQEEPNP
jgi:hypothetical protein